MSVAPGTKLGTYEILAPLGAGGMGEVYRAKDTRLAREVAIKVLPEEFFEGEERRQRFEREAKLLAALNHPNIAAIYSFEEISGRHLFVMELLEGETLRERLAEGPVPQRNALEYGLQIAHGLAGAAGGGRRNAVADADGDRAGYRDGDGGLHVARAGAREARRPALGHLLPRLDRLRDALGRAGLPRRLGG